MQSWPFVSLKFELSKTETDARDREQENILFTEAKFLFVQLYYTENGKAGFLSLSGISLNNQ